MFDNLAQDSVDLNKHSAMWCTWEKANSELESLWNLMEILKKFLQKWRKLLG